MMITCGLFVVRPDRKILVCHPTNHEWDQWDIPKGCYDESDPSFFDASLREFKEECGIDLRKEGYIKQIFKSHKFYKYTANERGGKLPKCLTPFLVTINRDFNRQLVCESMVSEGLKPYAFPEVDAFTWINYSQRKCLHRTQIKALEDFNSELHLFVDGNKYEKSHQYG